MFILVQPHFYFEFKEMADTDTDTNSTMLNNNNGTSIDYINYSSNSDQVSCTLVKIGV